MGNTINTKHYGEIEINDEIARGAREEAAAKPAGINFKGSGAPVIKYNGAVAVTLTPTVPVALGTTAQADSVAIDVATVVVDLNALLAKLRAAGVLAT